VIIGGPIDGKLIISGAIVGEAIIGEASGEIIDGSKVINGNDGTALAGQGSGGIVCGAIDGKSIISGAIVGGAIVREAIVGGDGAVLDRRGSNRKGIVGACSGRDELGGQRDYLEEIAGVCSGSNELRR
jgi:hypothetical protein